MSDDGSGQEAGRPLAQFSFQVDLGDGAKHVFAEMSGLDAEVAPIEYRTGSSPLFSAIKMPGLRKSSDVTLKRGVIASDSSFWAWLEGPLTKVAERRTVTIALVDTQGRPLLVWTLTNAAPVKVSGPELNGDGNDVAIETLELAYEGLSLRKPDP